MKTWHVEYDEELDLVILTFTGRIPPPEIEVAVSARIALGNEKGTRLFLNDTRKIIVDSSATLPAHSLPTKLYPENDEMMRESRIACIEPETPESKEIIRFWENSCLNRGWQVKLFERKQDAIDWLEQFRRPNNAMHSDKG
jgi:hypothetical protein